MYVFLLEISLFLTIQCSGGSGGHNLLPMSISNIKLCDEQDLVLWYSMIFPAYKRRHFVQNMFTNL